MPLYILIRIELYNGIVRGVSVPQQQWQDCMTWC